MHINRESDVAFVESIEAPTIIGGLAFGSIGSYKYCCLPSTLRRLVEISRRELNAFDAEARARSAIPLKG